MQFVIYGAGVRGRKIFNRWNKTDEIEFLAYYDQKVTGQCNGLPVMRWEEGNRSIPVLISLGNLAQVVQIYGELHAAGFTKLYWYQGDFNAKSFKDRLINTYRWGEAVLPQVEMHVADCCNLNCQGCTHFSPLFHAINTDLDSTLDDVKMLASKVSHILYFYILGGEPFMNPEIEEFIKGIRALLPNTFLTIVTNGLLIPRLAPSVLDCIRENKVIVSISEYEPTHQNIEMITECLKKAKIKYQIRPYDSKKVFNKPIEVHPSGNYPLKCISDGCINIYKGKISRCPTLMYVFKFNETFDENLPTDGIMDLSTCVSGRELIEKLQKPVPLCQHCVENSIPWGRCHGIPKLTDFAVV